MRQTVTLKEFAAEVAKLAKIANNEYYSAIVEFSCHREGEEQVIFQAYVHQGKIGRGETMQIALDALREKIAPAPLPETDVEIELNETDEIQPSVMAEFYKAKAIIDKATKD